MLRNTQPKPNTVHCIDPNQEFTIKLIGPTKLPLLFKFELRFSNMSRLQVHTDEEAEYCKCGKKRIECPEAVAKCGETCRS